MCLQTRGCACLQAKKSLAKKKAVSTQLAARLSAERQEHQLLQARFALQSQEEARDLHLLFAHERCRVNLLPRNLLLETMLPIWLCTQQSLHVHLHIMPHMVCLLCSVLLFTCYCDNIYRSAHKESCEEAAGRILAVKATALLLCIPALKGDMFPNMWMHVSAGKEEPGEGKGCLNAAGSTAECREAGAPTPPGQVCTTGPAAVSGKL